MSDVSAARLVLSALLLAVPLLYYTRLWAVH